MDEIKFLLKEPNQILKTFTTIKNKSHEPTKTKMFDLLFKDFFSHEKMEQKILGSYLKNKIKHLLKEEKIVANVIKEFKKNYKKKIGSSWRMGETYIRIKGVWHYLRAVDKDSDTIDCMLSKNCDKSAAKPFFTKAIRSWRICVLGIF